MSGSSGEVVQYTTTASRIGAYLGPIPHWLYFTPLRKHQAVWSQFVIWSSGIGTVAAILGIVIGVWMYSPSKRYRFDGAPARIPYRGQKRWHMVLGLIFGIGAATWAFSGMLSMDPFPSMVRRGRACDIAQALRGRPQLAAFAARDPRDALAQLPGLSVKELELVTVAGEPVYLATLGRGGTRDRAGRRTTARGIRPAADRRRRRQGVAAERAGGSRASSISTTPTISIVAGSGRCR